MTMRVFVTGGGGFIGREVVRQLRERGDDVAAIIRNPDQIAVIRQLGAQPIAGDLGSTSEIRTALDGCDAVIHLAGAYRVGIPSSQRPQMYEANVGATRRVLDAAIEAGIPRVVYTSTINVFGNTRGRIPDEMYRRDPTDGYVSYYDETKYLAHVAAESRIAVGAPVIIVQPGAIYGPGDHSAIGAQLKAAFDGSARVIVFGDLGISPVFVVDLAEGILAALDRGRLGEAYILGGECLRLRDAMGIAARAAGHRPPRISIPGALLRLAVPMGRLAVRVGTLGINVGEAVHAADGVTYWGSHAKATAELGYAPRPLSQGAVDAFGAH
jgi:nucleoside-diphosphate-sugar epimerase